MTETTLDVRRCSDCGQEWEAVMDSPFVCPKCGLISTLLGTHPLPETTAPTFAPGQRWKPKFGGHPSMSRIIKRLETAGIVYDEGWPSDVRDSFDRWKTWADWLLKTGAELS